MFTNSITCKKNETLKQTQHIYNFGCWTGLIHENMFDERKMNMIQHVGLHPTKIIYNKLKYIRPLITNKTYKNYQL